MGCIKDSDYHAILGAGVYTFIFIVSRAIGKYSGVRIGATLTDMDETVRKNLGLTLLPHSEVSLVFTGIAVSVIGKSAPEYALILSGTIAAAIIDEIIAVIMAKKDLSGQENRTSFIIEICYNITNTGENTDEITVFSSFLHIHNRSLLITGKLLLYQVKEVSQKDDSPNNIKKVVDTAFKDIGLSMGIAATVHSFLGQLDTNSAMEILGIGLACLAISALQNGTD